MGRRKRGVAIFYWDDQRQKKRKGFGPRAEAGGNILAFGGPSSSILQPSSVALQLERRWESKEDCCRERKRAGAWQRRGWIGEEEGKKEDEDDRKMLAMFCLSPVAKSGVEGNCSDDGVKTTWGHQERGTSSAAGAANRYLQWGVGPGLGLAVLTISGPDTGQEQRIGTSSSFFK